MSEYIDREKALEECDWYANEFCECEYAIMPLKGAIEIIPAADVCPYYISNKHDRGDDSLCSKAGCEVKAVRPVVRGDWKSKSSDFGNYVLFACSCCGMKTLREFNYCPNCGASMVNEDEG